MMLKKTLGRKTLANAAKKRFSMRSTGTSNSSNSNEDDLLLNEDLSYLEIAFLPKCVKQELITKQEKFKLNLPHSSLSQGVILFIDISGFTLYGSTLAKNFSDISAADEFSCLIKETFSSWATIVQKHNGEVVKFVGDALICSWETKSSSSSQLERSVALAKTAAVEMIKTFKSLTETSPGLDVHGGMATGTIEHIYLCKPQTGALRWHLLAGTALEKANSLLEKSQLGQVLLKDMVLTQNTKLEPLRRQSTIGKQIDYTSKLPSALVRAFIPRKLRGKGQLWGEMRRVTVMFIVLNVNPTNLPILNDCFTSISKNIHKHKGELVDLLFDDKGVVCIACFGSLKILENAELWAARAAIEVQKSSFTSSIGVSSGICFTGLAGTSERHQFTLSGDAVNRGSRLACGANPGEILLDIDCRDAINAFYEFTQKTVEKKKANYTETYTGFILGNKISRQRRSTARMELSPTVFVGRSIETTLVESFIQSIASSVALITVEAENGYGKSAFMDFIRRGGLPFDSVLAECHSIDEGTDFSVIKQIVESCVNLKENMTQVKCDETVATMEKNGIPIESLSQLLPYLAGEQKEENDDLCEDRLVDLLIAVLEYKRKSSASSPLLVLIEDSVWMDEKSCEVFLKLFRRKDEMSGVCFIMSFRPKEETTRENLWFETLAKAKGLVGKSTRVELGAIEEVECYRLIAFLFTQLFKRASRRSSMLLNNPTLVDEGVLELVYRTSQGVPSVIMEKVNWLFEKRIVQNKRGRIVFSSAHKRLQAENVSPDSIVEGVIVKFDKLSSLEKRILKVAACMGAVGSSISASVLEKVILKKKDVDKNMVRSALQDLVRNGFVLVDGKEMKFATLSTQQAVLTLVPSTTKEEIRKLIEKKK